MSWEKLMVVGPFQQIPIGEGATADLYLLRYDDTGRLRSPRTAQQLESAIHSVSDVYLFAHGWNNVFAKALERYRHFAVGYIEQRRRFALQVAPGYRPVLVGAIWPSTDFVLPWEAGPEIAAAPDPDSPEAAHAEQLLSYVTADLDPDADARFTELVDGRTTIGPDEAREAAEFVLAALWPGDDPDTGERPPSVEELLEAWAAMDGRDEATPADPDDFGTVGGGPTGQSGTAPGFAAGSLLTRATCSGLRACGR